MTNLSLHNVSSVNVKIGDVNGHTWTTVTINRRDNGKALEPVEIVLHHVDDLHLSPLPVNRS
jgi:hypothetical protein